MHKKSNKPAIYLDSSDYSVLASASGSPGVAGECLQEFVEAADAGTVRFVFSGAHIAEMAPLAPEFTDLAVARAKVLVRLCGGNAAISVDRLISLELQALHDGEIFNGCVVTNDGTWFPKLGDLLDKTPWSRMHEELDSALKGQGLNRKGRRSVQRNLFRKRQPTDALRDYLTTAGTGLELDAILDEYPMAPGKAQVISQYVLGMATKEDAEAAFLDSIRDPTWLMKWFSRHFDKLNPFVKWLRGPSAQIAAAMRAASEKALMLRELESSRNRPHGASLTKAQWTEIGETLVTDLVSSLSNRMGVHQSQAATVEMVSRYCPGLFTASRTLHSALWDSLRARPRRPRTSDFVDAIHALYAPYVDVFRADRYMSQIIGSHVPRKDTLVAPKLEDVTAYLRASF